jgi:hypothetical protein
MRGDTPWRALAVLTAAVVAVHLVFLAGVPLSLGAHAQAQQVAPLITRTIVPSPPPLPAVAPQAAQPERSPPRVATVRRQPKPAAPAVATVDAAPLAAAVPPESSSVAVADTAPAGPMTAAAPDAAEPSAPPGPSVPEPTPPAAPAAPEPVTAVQAVALPASVRLSYSVTGQQGVQPLGGVAADLLWTNDGERYEARLAFSFLFRTLRAQVSTGRVTPRGLAPERFGDKRRTEVAAHFEREKGTIVFSSNAPEQPLLPGAQDRVSVFFQLAGLMAATRPDGSAPAPGTIYAIQTVGPRDAAVWNFVVGQPERLRLPIGELDTVHLVREPRSPYDLKVDAWFAPSMGWLPVRLRLQDANGDLADQQLRATGAP